MSFFRRYLANGNPFTGAESNPVIWLDSSYAPSLYSATSGGTLVSTDNANVKRWEDRSGNGFHFTDATGVTLKKAIYAGLDTLRFSGSVKLVNAAATINLGNFTAVMVYRETTSKQSAGIISIGTSGAGHDYDVTNRMSINTGASASSHDFSVQRNYVTTGGLNYNETGPKPGQLRVRIVTFNQGIMRNWVNGGNPTAASFYNPVSTVSPAGISVGDRWLGGAFSGAGNGLNGDICEIILYQQCLTPVEVYQLNRHLVRKWDAVNYGVAVDHSSLGTDLVNVIYVQTVFPLSFIPVESSDMSSRADVNYTQTIEALAPATSGAAMSSDLSLTYAP